MPTPPGPARIANSSSFSNASSEASKAFTQFDMRRKRTSGCVNIERIVQLQNRLIHCMYIDIDPEISSHFLHAVLHRCDMLSDNNLQRHQVDVTMI